MARLQELRQIDALAAGARDGRSSAVVLAGEPGIGKSWLCQQAAERARGRPPRSRTWRTGPAVHGRSRRLRANRAVLAAPDELDDAFARAEALVAKSPSRFERGRTQLCWGERLRRDGRRVDARRKLRAALEHFDALGATPWAQRAERELGRSGRRASTDERGLATALTASESQIAAFVTQGKPNKEIAASLFLSPKTVQFHLGHIYRKLGLRSRTQLALTMARDAPALIRGD